MSKGRETTAMTAEVIFFRAYEPGSRDNDRLTKADHMLAAMVTFDSMCVHDGVLPALHSHTADELKAALAGYRHFGLDQAANVIESIADRASGTPLSDEQAQLDLDVELEDEYEAVCPPNAVDAAFERFYMQRPDDFARPSPEDVARHTSDTDFVRRL